MVITFYYLDQKIDIDIDNSTLISFTTNDEGTNLALDSDINFYGNTYNQVVLSSNNYLSFNYLNN